MPHPERACELAVGSADGLVVLESVVKAVGQGAFASAATSAKVVAAAR